MELTEKQEKAIESLERAFKKCHKANIYFHNCYGTLKAFDGFIVDEVTDGWTNKETEITCDVGYYVETIYNLCSWADDQHYVHLKLLIQGKYEIK